MAKRSLSLRALAHELNADTDHIAALCKREGVLPVGWVEVEKRGRKEWRGHVSAGLAETIRQWHREGLLPETMTRAEYDGHLIQCAEGEAHRCRSNDLGDQLEAIILAIKKFGIDPLTALGRQFVWDAWERFIESGVDYERWADCQKCDQSFQPEIDRYFAETLINRCCKPTRKWRVREHRFFNCPDCQ